MNRLWRFITRIGRSVRPATAIAFFRRVAGVVLFLAVLGGLVLAVQTVPEWQVKRASVRSAVVNPEAKTTPAEVAALQNEMRKTFIQVIGGAFALFALYFTYRRVKVAEQGHITDWYTKAIEQLGALTAAGKPNVEVRLGAIYALERIAIDSARDHWTIMEVLTAYVRQNAPKPELDPTEEENKEAIAKGPATEIQAVLTILGRRRRSRKREQKGQRLNLGGSDLRGASFYGAQVEGAWFDNAHLEGASIHGAYAGGASFFSAHLEGAWFEKAHLKGAIFDVAHVERAIFGEAELNRAGFNGAHMEGAILRWAHLKDASFFMAHLEGTDFAHAEGLSVKHFDFAHGLERALFDEAFLQESKSAKAESDSVG